MGQECGAAYYIVHAERHSLSLDTVGSSALGPLLTITMSSVGTMNDVTCIVSGVSGSVS